MNGEVGAQLSNILEGMWYGLWIAAAYDVLRILRRVIRFGVIQVNLQDFLFWVITGLVLFSMMFQCNDGIVRGYLFLSVFSGGWLYHKSVSSWVVKYLSKIINKIFTILLKKPLRWSKIIIIRIFKVLLWPLKQGVLWLKSIVKGGNRNNGKHNDKEKKKRKTRDVHD